MAVWSSLFLTEGSSTASSDGSSLKHGVKFYNSLTDTLRCYVCDEYFSKPRILPCGHTFCSDCLMELRHAAHAEFNKSRDRNAHRRGDCGYFTCPWPQCHYGMKLMNVSRWSLRNRAMAHAVTMAKKQDKERQTTETQTTLDLRSALLPLPKSVFKKSRSNPYLAPVPVTPPPSPTSMMIQHVLQNALSTDSVDAKHYLPPAETENTWKSAFFAVGMAVLDQVLKFP